MIYYRYLNMDSRTLKKYIKTIDPNARVATIKAQKGGVKYDYSYRVWNFNSPRDLRIIALRVVYGDSFEINENAIAGNVTGNSISISPSQWEKTINWYERIRKL